MNIREVRESVDSMGYSTFTGWHMPFSDIYFGDLEAVCPSDGHRKKVYYIGPDPANEKDLPTSALKGKRRGILAEDVVIRFTERTVSNGNARHSFKGYRILNFYAGQLNTIECNNHATSAVYLGPDPAIVTALWGNFGP